MAWLAGWLLANKVELEIKRYSCISHLAGFGGLSWEASWRGFRVGDEMVFHLLEINWSPVIPAGLLPGWLTGRLPGWLAAGFCWL